MTVRIEDAKRCDHCDYMYVFECAPCKVDECGCFEVEVPAEAQGE